MCLSAIIKVKCKLCIAKGFGTMELIDYQVCDPPCERHFPLHEWPADTVAERENCEICKLDFPEESEGGDEKKALVIRFRRDSQANARPWDWSEQDRYLASDEYGITLGGVSIEHLDAAEELASIQEQLNARSLGKALPWKATLQSTTRARKRRRVG